MLKLGALKSGWMATLLVGLLLVTVSAYSFAVETGGVGGKPANPRSDNPRSQSIFVYELKPGQEITDAIRIYNNTEQVKTISVYPTDSIVSSGGAFACAQAADKVKDVGGWIKLDHNEANLSAGKNQEIKFVLKVPQDAEPGEHNGCIAIQEQKPAVNNSNNGVALSMRSAIRVAITIPGKISKQLSYTNLKVTLQSKKIIVSTYLRNNGNVSLDATITTTVKGLLAGVSGETVQGTYPTLPKTVTELNFEFKKPFWGGWYRAESKASYNANSGQSLGQGKNNKTSSSQSIVFFVTPSPLATVLYLLIVLLIAAVVYFIWRQYWKIPKMAKSFKTYEVKIGDNIHNIAKQSDISWKLLANINKLKAPYHLTVGSKIVIPETSQLFDKQTSGKKVSSAGKKRTAKKGD